MVPNISSHVGFGVVAIVVLGGSVLGGLGVAVIKVVMLSPELGIGVTCPVTKTSVSRRAKPKARSLSHKYMVISGDQPCP